MIKVVIIGCGRIAGGHGASLSDSFSHAGAYSRNSKFKIVGCVDTDQSRLNDFQNKWKIPEAFDSVDNLLKSNLNFDIVSICTNTEYHVEVLEQLLKSDIKIAFTEKPLSIAEIGDDLIEKYRTNNKSIAVNYTRRWSNAFRDLKEEIKNGKYGGIQKVIGRYVGGILNNGSHLIDFISFLAGPVQPTQVVPESIREYENDIGIDAILMTGNKVPVYIINFEPSPYFIFEVDIYTDKGAISIQESGFQILIKESREDELFPGDNKLVESSVIKTDFSCCIDNAIKNLSEVFYDKGSLACDAKVANETENTCRKIRYLASSKLD